MSYMTSNFYRLYWLISGLVCLLFLDVGILTVVCHAKKSSTINIRCFVYHRFGDSRYPSTNIATKDFQNHLEYLQQNDFHVITLGDALERLQEERDIPDKTVVLTVDDGYASFYTHAMPLLRQYGSAVRIS